jgi:hypothetical protein
MRHTFHVPTWFVSLFVLILITAPPTLAQAPTAEAQVAEATLPLPDEMRAGASVIGWNESGERRAIQGGVLCRDASSPALAQPRAA